MFFPGRFRGQRLGRIYSHPSCSECLNLCGPAFVMWLAYSVFITAESGLTFPLWAHRAVLCRDCRAGVEEVCVRRYEPIYIYLYVHQSHSLIVCLLPRCLFTALACDVLQSLIRLPPRSKLHPFVVR